MKYFWKRNILIYIIILVVVGFLFSRLFSTAQKPVEVPLSEAVALSQNVEGDELTLTTTDGSELKVLGKIERIKVEDDELLSLASRSGCVALFIGFETLSQDGLREINKSVNKRIDYKDAIARIRSHGIGIYGAFILGLDADTRDVFGKTLKFAINNRLEAANFAVLTPHPGTSLRAKLEEEDRIIHSDWSKYDGGNVAFKPNLMSPEELQKGHDRMKQQFYSLSSIIKRLSGKRKNLSFFLPYNFMYNKSLLKKLATGFGKIRY